MQPKKRWGRWWLPMLLLAVLALVAGACGDDDDPAIDPGDDTGSASGTGTGDDEGPPEFDAGTTMAKLQSAGKIKVGTKFDQPLFGLKDPVSGDVEGFDVEIAKLIAQKIFGGSIEDAGEKIEFVETVSANREPFIEQGQVDFVV